MTSSSALWYTPEEWQLPWLGPSSAPKLTVGVTYNPTTNEEGERRVPGGPPLGPAALPQLCYSG